MSTFIYILLVAGCGVIAFWLVLAICFGVGLLGQRGNINAGRETAARMFGRTSRPVGRARWILISIVSVPLLLFGAAVVIVHFFSSLLIHGWCRLIGKPVPQPRSLQDFDDDDMV